MWNFLATMKNIRIKIRIQEETISSNFHLLMKLSNFNPIVFLKFYTSYIDVWIGYQLYKLDVLAIVRFQFIEQHMVSIQVCK
jgi:hypothetical protein